jgi:hypothetical protein
MFSETVPSVAPVSAEPSLAVLLAWLAVLLVEEPRRQ